MNLNFKKVEVLIEKEKTNKIETEVIVGPIEKGYGTTFGNSLRRVLISSMPGTAVVAFRIDGVNHELMSIPGTATDTVELISQLKTLRFGKISDEDVVLKMHIKKNGEYYAKDIEVIEGVDLRTPDVLLLRSLGDREITLELILRKHRGFIEARKHTEIPEGFVQVDGMFSPIERVSYEVKEAMVEQEFSHEQVKFTITTDGTIDAKDAIQLGAKIVRKHFEIFEDMSERMTDTEIFQEKERERESIDNTSIEELELSVRSTNALKLAGVKTVGELRRVNETELKDFKNMGITSVIEVKDKLKKLGVGLGEY